MDRNNITTILLLGFPELHRFKMLLFLIFLIIFLITISVNLMVILLVSYSKNLHTPMYFFLSQLTASDILLTSDIGPNLLHVILNNGSSMSLPGCFIQFLFFGSCEVSECLLLTMMLYDRYVAVCKPLHYESVMTRLFCQKFVVISWIFSFVLTSIQTVNISQLHFCGSNIIDHFFCELDPIIQLSCSNILDIETYKMYLCITVVVCPFLIIVVSYSYIGHTILKIQTLTERRKAFRTCSSHLIVVFIFYGTLSCMYLIPVKGKSTDLSKLLSLFYTVVTPLINPIIYCLRNKDIKKELRKLYFCRTS